MVFFSTKGAGQEIEECAALAEALEVIEQRVGQGQTFHRLVETRPISVNLEVHVSATASGAVSQPSRAETEQPFGAENMAPPGRADVRHPDDDLVAIGPDANAGSRRFNVGDRVGSGLFGR